MFVCAPALHIRVKTTILSITILFYILIPVVIFVFCGFIWSVRFCNLRRRSSLFTNELSFHVRPSHSVRMIIHSRCISCLKSINYMHVLFSCVMYSEQTFTETCTYEDLVPQKRAQVWFFVLFFNVIFRNKGFV